MPPLSPTLRLLSQSTASTTRAAARSALSARLNANTNARSFPVISECPPSTCSCSETPSGLDIDYKTDLNGTAPPVNRHVLVPSGQSDWESKIEDEQRRSDWGKFVAGLKQGFGRIGRFHDPSKSISISTCSLPIKTAGEYKEYVTEALLFPQFQTASCRKHWFLNLPKLGSHILAGTASSESIAVEENGSGRSEELSIRPISNALVLVCTHNGRDKRCGVMGPLLVKEFESQLGRYHTTETRSSDAVETTNTSTFQSLVAGISHVGGHKWAGNVIIYIPPKHTIATTEQDGGSHETKLNPLAGKGIWYGRVEPKHVDGIIRETILGGRVIEELFRGGMDERGNSLRL